MADTKAYVYGDDLISQATGAATQFFHYDGLGSTRSLSDATGTLTDSYNYDAFGQILNQTGTTENSYLFTGEQFDQGLNNYYLRARYYNQGIGQFTQQDTWMGISRNPITLNKYLYADVDPVSRVDPTGKFSIGSLSAGMKIQAVLGATAIAAVGFSAVDFNLSSQSIDFGFSSRQNNWILLAAMAGAGSPLLDLVTSKLAENAGGNVVMYHGSSLDSLVQNGDPPALLGRHAKFDND